MFCLKAGQEGVLTPTARSRLSECQLSLQQSSVFPDVNCLSSSHRSFSTSLGLSRESLVTTRVCESVNSFKSVVPRNLQRKRTLVVKCFGPI